MTNREFEAKFLDIDKDEMRKLLKKNGATLVHEKKKYIRAVFHRCTDEVRGFARIRDEAGIITMTVKLYTNPQFPEEYEVSIKDSFETGLKFLSSLGLKQKAFQETYREKWSHDLVHEITFDDVPGLPTYMEIDCTGEEKLNKMIELLGLSKNKMRYGAFDATYEEYYGIPKNEINNETPLLTFDNIITQITPRKNKDLLEKFAKSYKNMEGGRKSRKINKQRLLMIETINQHKKIKDYKYKYEKYKSKYTDN